MGRDGHEPTARELLLFEDVGVDCFRACHNLDNHMDAAFGGQFLGQALAAASATVDGRPVSSLNGYFFRAGKVAEPIDYRVERISDGRRFASRQVTALQQGRPVFGLQCSFHDSTAEVGAAAHQVEAPANLPDPESLPNLAGIARDDPDRVPGGLLASLQRGFPIELRPLCPLSFLEDEDRAFWFRMPSALAVEGESAHQALLALMSDYWLPAAIATRHNDAGLRYALTSLNHSMWFHRPVRADQWLLYSTDSHWAGHGRGLARGMIFTRDGKLAATAVQEALLLAM